MKKRGYFSWANYDKTDVEFVESQSGEFEFEYISRNMLCRLLNWVRKIFK